MENNLNCSQMQPTCLTKPVKAFKSALKELTESFLNKWDNFIKNKGFGVKMSIKSELDNYSEITSWSKQFLTELNKKFLLEFWNYSLKSIFPEFKNEILEKGLEFESEAFKNINLAYENLETEFMDSLTKQEIPEDENKQFYILKGIPRMNQNIEEFCLDESNFF